MREVDDSSIYAVVSGEMPLRLTFDSPKRGRLVSVGVTDTLRRPWIDIDRNKGTYNVTVFPADDPTPGAPASRTYMDSDGDGITDAKVDWQDGQRYHMDSPIRWAPGSASSEQGKKSETSDTTE
ncbi:MAG TPA: hypothetical protein VNA25_26500 [Phycisphaerae bacterium]|nr:hypothetical protein [Phycisphaerae bacterium]